MRSLPAPLLGAALLLRGLEARRRAARTLQVRGLERRGHTEPTIAHLVQHLLHVGFVVNAPLVARRSTGAQRARALQHRQLLPRKHLLAGVLLGTVFAAHAALLQQLQLRLERQAVHLGAAERREAGGRGGRGGARGGQQAREHRGEGREGRESSHGE